MRAKLFVSWNLQANILYLLPKDKGASKSQQIKDKKANTPT